jgi:glycosyltransferase involved in cell wall biosynthesis
LRLKMFPKLKLVVVGALGWHHKSILHRFRPWMERGEACLLKEVPASELRMLYRHARATICPSFCEGFDFSGVEAMRSGGAVVASDIPVHREIYADAAEYFNPYSTEALSEAIQNVIDPRRSIRRHQLVTQGAIIAQRYTHDLILSKWRAFLFREPQEEPAKLQVALPLQAVT